jgi:tetratricopeptide (TPR) repeat protein
MKTVLVTACLIPILVLSPQAQTGSKSGGGAARAQSSSVLRTSSAVLLSGKVVVSDGTPLPESVIIQSICRGQRRTEAHTDSLGNFSFQFGDRFSSAIDAGFDADAPLGNQSGMRSASNDAGDCELKASLAGFSSDSIALGGRLNGSESVDLGRITLRRVQNVQGLTISATTAAAPDAARKALAKGQERESKDQWEQAQKLFEKAVRLYPNFAVAWFELGNVQLRQNQIVAARQSFERSIGADDKYVSPYRGLMQLAINDRNWHEVVDSTDKILALNPINFPDVWFANALGHFYLGDLMTAEKSALRGSAIDSDHHIPKLEYLLGIVMLRRSNYPEATRHLQAFLKLATRPSDVAEAQRQLDEVTRLSTATVSAEVK